MDPGGLTTASFEAWLQTYGKAWEERDPDAFAALFSEDASYAETPFEEPMRGREAIRAYVAQVPTTQDQIAFGYEVIATAGDRGVATWNVSYVRLADGSQNRLDGVLLASFAEGLCTSFREWWHSTGPPAF